jgi:hypothetical protein
VTRALWYGEGKGRIVQFGPIGIAALGEYRPDPDPIVWVEIAWDEWTESLFGG